MVRTIGNKKMARKGDGETIALSLTKASVTYLGAGGRMKRDDWLASWLVGWLAGSVVVWLLEWLGSGRLGRRIISEEFGHY